MKRISIFVTYALIIAPMVASAQLGEGPEAKEPPTKLEAFLAEKGTLFIKDFYELGEVAGRYGANVAFKALVIYAPGQESQRLRGLKITITEGGSYERSNTSFLDLEEIESLSKAIAYMTDLSAKWKSKEYTEVIFSTKGDFNIGFFQTGADKTAFSSCGYVSKASCYFRSMEDLISIKATVDRGLALLGEK
jgi:hypothetical protein